MPQAYVTLDTWDGYSQRFATVSGSGARWAAVAFVASYSSPGTRRAYSTQLRLWLEWRERHGLDSLTEPRRPHVELYAREQRRPGLVT